MHVMLFFLTASFAFAQTRPELHEVWSRCFRFPGNDNVWSVEQAKDSSLYVVGCKDCAGEMRMGILAQIVPNGDTLWLRQFPGCWFTDLRIIDSNSLVIGGSIKVNDEEDSIILWVSTEGDSLTCRRFGLRGNDRIKEITPSHEGGFLCAGYASQTRNNQTMNGLLMKTDRLGDTLWTYESPIGGDDGYSHVIQNGNATIAVLGDRTSPVTKSSNSCITLFTDAGDTVWSHEYGTGFDEHAKGFAKSVDGGYLITSWTDRPGTSDDDLYFVKTDVQGTMLFSQTSDKFGLGGLQATSIFNLSDSILVVSGTAFPKSGSSRACLLAIGNDANIAWYWLANTGNTIATAACSAWPTGIFVIGMSYSQDYDVCLWSISK